MLVRSGRAYAFACVSTLWRTLETRELDMDDLDVPMDESQAIVELKNIIEHELRDTRFSNTD